MSRELVFSFKDERVPLYSEDRGYGFTDSTCAIKPRRVETYKIRAEEEACRIKEEDEARFEFQGELLDEVTLNTATRYDLGGMVFRVNVPAGTYKIEVETTSGQENTLVAVSGLKAANILREGWWDAAHLVPVRYPARWIGSTWTYTFVNGRQYIDIEIEPKKPGVEVGVKGIKVTELESVISDEAVHKDLSSTEEEKFSIFTLGDSTAKSYVFEEAPMCGWGQLFDDLFDLSKVNVINYSQGGRSLKVMYFEGRFNDLLLSGKKGDYVLLQSGHNDERDNFEGGETARFGRGATEEMFQQYLEEVFIPSIKIRGMIPVLVTPMIRVDERTLDSKGRYHDSFTSRRFPKIMRETAHKWQIPLIDLNAESINYVSEIGKEGAEAIVLSVEAGESPGKTNSGSFANGNPTNDVDHTHMKEALAKVYAQKTAEGLYNLAKEVKELKKINTAIKSEVKEAVESGNWGRVYPEHCKDTIKGEGAYYRNQIEKMIQIGALEKDEKGLFYPKEEITVETFEKALIKVFNLSGGQIIGEDMLNISAESEEQRAKCILTREVMAVMLLRAYELKFGFRNRPKYMTDYNGNNITPDNPEYDPNLIGEEAQYYPLAGYECLQDTNEIESVYSESVKKAYNLGLIRSERDIERGRMINGTYLEPKKKVTREKAAKSLYFMWVLAHSIKEENDKGIER